MITSLTTRFSTLVLNKEHEQLKLKSKIELEEQFNQIKEKYLNKPLDALEKNINEISKNNDAIKKASSKIDESIENINSKYINQILDKLEKYEIQLNKIEKKIEVE
jgi:methyl-accepting chemotaxis protein